MRSFGNFRRKEYVKRMGEKIYTFVYNKYIYICVCILYIYIYVDFVEEPE